MERAILLSGKSVLPKQPVELRAGHLTAQYKNGAVRYIKAGDVEILRMIYSAVRDHNWGTVEPIIRDEKIEKHAYSFQIRYVADYQQNDISFQAEYTISGSAAGHIRFTIRGTAKSSFLKNRVGFCILHPVQECAGRKCVIQHPDGSQTEGEFPQNISPHQPFKNIQSMSWQPADDIHSELFYTGDIFEMEDQRNWIDASYKTYCTPLEFPFPVQVDAGQVIEQAVELKVKGKAEQKPKLALSFAISNDHLDFPKIGIGASFQKTELDEQSVSMLKELGLHHYRIDIFLSEKNWQSDLSRELLNAAKLNVKVEAVLHVVPDDFAAFTVCIEQLKKASDGLACIVVLNVEKKSTDAELLNEVVPDLRTAFPGVPIGAGTDCFFTELNRERTPTDLIDFLTFSINPQVHVFDNQSLTETLQGHQYVVESAQQFANGKIVHVSPVTFKMRFNPNATGPEPEPEIGELPAAVDPRQMSLYGAAWTLGSIKYLAESGANFITYNETVGLRGVMQGDQDSEFLEKFVAVKGQVFPLWQVLKWVLEFQNGKIIPVASPQPLVVDGLLLELNEKQRLIAANYTLQPQYIEFDKSAKDIAVLDEHSVKSFIQNPHSLQANPYRQNGVELLPYAIACIAF